MIYAKDEASFKIITRTQFPLVKQDCLQAKAGYLTALVSCKEVSKSNKLLGCTWKKLIGRIWGDRLVAREVVGLKMMLFLMFKYHLYEYECISGLTWYPKTMAQSGQYSSPNGSRSLQVSVFHVISSNLCLHVPNMVHVTMYFPWFSSFEFWKKS